LPNSVKKSALGLGKVPIGKISNFLQAGFYIPVMFFAYFYHETFGSVMEKIDRWSILFPSTKRISHLMCADPFCFYLSLAQKAYAKGATNLWRRH